MKRVVCCVLCIVFLIATVSAITPVVQKTLIPATLVTQQVLVRPSALVSIQPSATPTLGPDEAIIKIQSTPSGANVFIGGYLYPNPTPWDVKMSYAPTVWPIIISYPGYQNYSESLTILPGQTYTVSAVLIPNTPVPTTLPSNPSVDSVQTNQPSNPPVDSAQMNQPPFTLSATPVTPVLDQGAVTTQVLPGISSNGTTGSLSVTTTPAGAEISVDGQVKGISPTVISGISPGTHALNITKEGYRDFSTTVIIEAGKQNEYSTGLTTTAKSPGFFLIPVIAVAFSLVLIRKKLP